VIFIHVNSEGPGLGCGRRLGDEAGSHPALAAHHDECGDAM
jgi:hypothetical protein